jgi:hypothetical protein
MASDRSQLNNFILATSPSVQVAAGNERLEGTSSFLPQQLRWVHRQSAACGNPGGGHTYERHDHDRPGQDQRIARRRLVNELREQTTANHSQKQAKERAGELKPLKF